MGSSFVTFEEAGRLLERSRRQIYTYIKQGLLTQATEDSKVVLHRSEVEQLANELSSGTPPLTRKNFNMLLARMKRLEERVEIMTRIWGLQEENLRFKSKLEAKATFSMFTDSTTRMGNWDIQEVKLLAPLLNKVDCDTLTELKTHTGEAQPWKPIYEVAKRMTLYVQEMEGYETTLDLQALATMLEQGRKKLVGAITLWVELGNGTVPVQGLAGIESPKANLLRRIGPKNSKRK